jgi:hypothetical protein
MTAKPPSPAPFSTSTRRLLPLIDKILAEAAASPRPDFNALFRQHVRSVVDGDPPRPAFTEDDLKLAIVELMQGTPKP